VTGKGVLPSPVGVPAIFFRLVAAGPGPGPITFRQRLSPVDSSRPALTRQANGRADASHEGGAPTG